MSPLAILLAFGLGCGSDSKVTAYTTPPEVAIQTPPDGTTVDQAVDVSMRGLVVDAEFSDRLDEIVAQWSVGGEAICDGSTVDSGGNVDCVYAFPTSGAVELSLTVTNPDGASATATSNLTVARNAAPSVAIGLPTSTGKYYSDQLVNFQATTSDAEDAPTDLHATWTSDLDGTLDVDTAPDSDGVLQGTSMLTEGQHIISLAVQDTTGLVGTDSVVIDVGPANTAPTCAITAPENNLTAIEGSTIVFQGTATDPDVPATSLGVVWSSNLDGVLSTAAPTSTGTMSFGAVLTTLATHTITLTVTDEIGATCTEAILVSLGNAPSISIDAPADGTTWNQGSAIAFQATATDADTASTDLSIEWSSSADGVLSTAGADTSGISSFSSTSLSRGAHTIQVRAQDPDGFYATDTVSITVNGLPNAPVVSITPDPPTSTDTLTANIVTDSVDPEGSAVSYGYAWRRNGAATTYTSDTVPASATVRGETWAVTVTPTDGLGSGTPGTDSVVIGNSAPSVASATISPTSPTEADTLTCVAGATADNDGDTVSLSYTWTVSGVTASSTSSTLAATSFVKGDAVTCTITPNDGTVNGASVTSSAVTVLNSAPNLASVNLSPTNAYEATILTCAPGTATDADGDTITYSYDWTVGGATLGLDSSTLTGSWFDKGDAVTCTVTPNDGTASGTPVVSNTVTIRNTAPSVASATLSPSTAYETSTLTCTAGSTSDVDGDTVTVSYGWIVNGSTSLATSSTLTGTWFNKGDTVACTVTPNDGTAAGTAVSSSSITIQNSAPSASSVSISPTDPYTDDGLTATASGWSDADGDAAAYTWQWYINGAAVSSGGTSSTLTSTHTVKHDLVYVVATPNDGTTAGAPVTSAELEILNTPPTAPTVLVTPTDAQPEDDLLCSVTTDGTDLDGDTITYSYAWYLSGVASGVTSTTLSASYTVDGDSWTCVVTPFDGDDNGTAGSDAQEVVDRTAPSRPVISAIDSYRNSTSVSLTGTSEASSTVTIYMDCSGGSLTSSSVTTGTDGTWSATMSMPRGETCNFYAYATDAHGNVSTISNIVSTESCNPYDSYEDSTSYGDVCKDPVDAWAVLPDDGTGLYAITGNIIEPTDDDWYVIDTSQSVLTTGTNVFRFDVTMVAGTSDYAFAVYRGGCGTSSLACTDGAGGESAETQYTYYAQDVGDGGHAIPTETRYCGASSPYYNTCDDLSSTYYIHVWRTSSAMSCAYYTLDVTNGAW